MSELTRHIARDSYCRALLTLVLLLALAGAADRLAAAYGPLGGGDNSGCRLGLSAANGSIPEAPPENMAGTGKPVHTSSACLLVQYVLKDDNGNGRTKYYQAVRAGSEACVIRRFSPGRLCPTASLIDSDLGRQFTLVGARPSGTS